MRTRVSSTTAMVLFLLYGAVMHMYGHSNIPTLSLIRCVCVWCDDGYHSLFEPGIFNPFVPSQCEKAFLYLSTTLPLALTNHNLSSPWKGAHLHLFCRPEPSSSVLTGKICEALIAEISVVTLVS